MATSMQQRKLEELMRVRTALANIKNLFSSKLIHFIQILGINKDCKVIPIRGAMAAERSGDQLRNIKEIRALIDALGSEA